MALLPNSTCWVPSAWVMTMQGTLIAPYWSLSSGKCETRRRASARTAGLREAMRWEASTVSGHIVQVSETRIMMFSGSVMDFARSIGSSPSGWPGPAALYWPSTNELNSWPEGTPWKARPVKTSEPLPSLPGFAVALSRHADAHGRTGERQDAGDVEMARPESSNEP